MFSQELCVFAFYYLWTKLKLKEIKLDFAVSKNLTEDSQEKILVYPVAVDREDR